MKLAIALACLVFVGFAQGKETRFELVPSKLFPFCLALCSYALKAI